VLKQSKDASADALADLDELEEIDDEEYESDDSGNKSPIIQASPQIPQLTLSQSISDPPRR
jgi:hypothetical protein